MSRFFNLHEAEQLIPVLEGLLRAAIDSKQKVEKVDTELSELSQRIVFNGGVLVDFERVAGLKSVKDTSAEELKDALTQIEASGCLIKDLDVGLIDFPCLVDDREIYLCWKLGETAIRFWHNTDEGFQGRKPIDPDWVDGSDSGRKPN